MKFLTVLILVTFYRGWMGGHPLRGQFPVSPWFSFVAGRIASGVPGLLVAIALPSVLLLLLSLELQSWFFGFFWLALSVFVLIYCVDIVDTDSAFSDQFQWLEGLEDDDKSIVQYQESQAEFSEDVTYRAFKSMVPVLFWFLLLGPAGALFVFLSRCYLQQLEEDAGEAEALQLITFWIEWFPARVSILVFAALGEFSHTWEVLGDSLFETRDAAITSLARAADSAVGRHQQEFSTLEEFVTRTEIELNLLKHLLQRSLWGWLSVAAILTILGL